MDSAAHVELDRVQALHNCSILDSAPDPTYDDLARLAASICDAPIALVSLVDSARQWFKARVGMEESQTPRDVAFCHYTIQSDAPFIVEDATADDRFRDNPMVTAAHGLRFYAGIPIRVEGVHRVGALCVKDRRPRRLTSQQIVALTTLANQVSSQLDLRLNISRLEAAKAELTRATLAAEAGNRVKSIFLANMSHEIRTPLTAIIGFGDLLADGVYTPAEQADALSTLRRSSRHLLSLVNDLMDLSRIEAGELKIAPSPCDLRAVLEDTRRLVQPVAAGKDLSLRICVDRNVPFRCLTDSARLRQIVLNLLDNAVKFTQYGAIEVRASMQGDVTLRLEIQDTGIGIEAVHLDRIFSPFEQGDPSTTRRYGGTGLGLAIGRRLALAMGGDLTVRSLPGTGSTFTLTVHAPAASVSDEEPRPREFITGAQQPLAHRRILVAEDGIDNQRLIRLVLAKGGADVSVVANGSDAVEEALAAEHRGQPFDIVVMDMQMPVMDGYDAARTLRARGSTTPVLALTAHAMTGAREECLAAGCVEYMSKPIDRHALVLTCARIIETHAHANAATPTAC